MKIPTNKWNFGCHACGKCCNSSPSLTFSEVIEQSKNFFIRLAIQPIPMRQSNEVTSPSGNVTLNARQKAKMKENEKQLWTGVDAEGGVMMLHMFPIAYDGQKIEDGHTCPMLQDNGMCGIYENRPAMCKSVPLSTVMPEIMQGLKLQAFEKYGCASKEPKEGLKPIFNGFKLEDGPYKDAREEMRSQIISEKHIAQEIMIEMMKGNERLPSMDYILTNVGSMMSFPMSDVIFILLGMEEISIYDAISFYENQTHIIEKRLEAETDFHEIRILETDLFAISGYADIVIQMKP